MTAAPEWLVKQRASVRSIRNEQKAMFSKKPCKTCGVQFQPISKYSLFCNKCKLRQSRML